MNVAPDPHAAVARTRALLERYWERTAGMEPSERQRGAALCAAYGLRGLVREEALSHLRELAEGVQSRRPEPPARRAAPTGYGAVMLQDLCAELLGEEACREATRDPQALKALEQRVRDLNRRLDKAVGGLSGPSSLLEAAQAAADRLDGVSTAMRRAAEEFTGLLLDSLDPREQTEEQAGKGFAPAFYRKSSGYDAVLEKFDQVRSYHEAGRLSRDLRALFKKQLVKESER